MRPVCTCVMEIGDVSCEVHDLYGDDPPPYILDWHRFLKSVDVRGPLPCRFRIHKMLWVTWILESRIYVPDRDDPSKKIWVIFTNELKDDDCDKRLLIRQRVLGMYQHEALESIFIGSERVYDPHEARWQSSLVVDWRYNV